MKYAVILFLFVSMSSFSQDADLNLEKTLKSYDEYFQAPRESIYLHLNKSSYLRGESLWYQGYAYDRRNQKLSQDVRNVELRLYNSAGKMLDKQLLLVVNGKFFGQLEIDESFADGEYYLKAETNWMKNFEEEYVHVQKFEVINSEIVTQTQNKASYDLQILPEGGHLVTYIKGKIAIKLLNNKGLGVQYEASLLENGVEINQTKSNRFGHASLNITPKSDAEYKLKVVLPNDKVLEKAITKINNYGQTLVVSNSRKDYAIVTVSSNMPEDYDYASQNFELVIHKEGDRFSFPIELTKENTSITKKIDRKYLFSGVNTLTLMLNGMPISERLIFNRASLINTEEAIAISDFKNTSKDSITLELKMPELKEKAYISISVLPKNTISYQKNNNIVSSFLLEPFVNGFIEDRGYYFTEPDKEKDYNLDLLLLTQGWSKYDWNNILYNSPDLYFERKDGITQMIDINERIPNKAESLILFNTIYNNERVFPTDSIYLNTIVLNNRYPFVGETMEFSYFTKNEKFKKPKIAVGSKFRLYDDELDADFFEPSIKNQRPIALESDEKQLYSNFLTSEFLDEVIVKVDKSKTKGVEENYANSYFAQKVKVDEEMANTFPFFADYLAYRGLVLDGNGIRFLARNSLLGNNSPAVYLNGMLMMNYYELLGTRTSDYEEIIIDRTGIGMGMLGGGGVIRLKYRISPIFTDADGKSITDPYTKIDITEGFNPPKSFYNPEYSFYNTEAFQLVGTIGWEPNITLNPGSEHYLNLVDTGLNELTLFIEGITDEGKLIFIEKDFLNTKDSQNQP